MYIGAHVSTSGGLKNAIQNGLNIGAEALQIFPSAPLQWRIRGWDDEQCAAFKQEWPKHFKQVVFHGIYLTNLAAESSENAQKTKAALIETLQLAPRIGVEATVFHPGNYRDGKLAKQDQITQLLKEILENSPEESLLVFENSAGGTIGGKLEDLAWLLEAAGSSRARICLDTCHAFAAGYDITSDEGYERYIQEIEKLIGLDKVYCWHFNDSKFSLGAKRDRHENIGEGFIGTDAFKRIINDARFSNLSAYLEVPGFDNSGPDKQNIDILKKIRVYNKN